MHWCRVLQLRTSVHSAGYMHVKHTLLVFPARKFDRASGIVAHTAAQQHTRVCEETCQIHLQCAASAVGTMPSIMFFPLLTFSFFIALFAYWVRIFAYQWSAGTVTPVTDPTRGSSDFYTLSWMYSPGGSNTTIDGSSGVQPAPAEAGNSTVECYEDPNCYYDVQFSQEQMVRTPRHTNCRLLVCSCEASHMGVFLCVSCAAAPEILSGSSQQKLRCICFCCCVQRARACQLIACSSCVALPPALEDSRACFRVLKVLHMRRLWLQGYFGYHLFGLLWTNQVIVGFGYLVIAHCIGQYYWTRGLREHMTNHPVLTGIRVALRYHLGSVAFGGFIVAVIQFVRLLLEYMDRKTKKMQKNNVAAKWLMCCLKYCLWCAATPSNAQD